jgi:translation initiation factor IF-3
MGFILLILFFMRRTWRKAQPKPEKRFLSNQMIKAPEVFLIDETGEQIGAIPTREALQRARDINLDLVEVNPTASPPVAKIVDYGQLKYEREKKAHKQKVAQKKIDTKGIRLSVRISQNDLQLRINQAIKFFKKGDKVKVEIVLKGRERQHPEKAVEIVNEFITALDSNEGINVLKEQALTKQGGRFIMILVNKKD